MHKALRQVENYGMLPEGCTVVAGVSGGADSMALLHFLLWYAQERHIRVISAHVNHGLRGRESDADEAFVREWCERRGIACEVLRADVHLLARKRKCGLEECGRHVRYAFFESLAGEYNARVATAHTLSDQAETVLLHLVQGSGGRGLTGIPPVRGRIVRPLLTVTRKEVEDYCEINQIPFRTDRTNFSLDYTRNRLRLQVIPLLKGLNPLLEEGISRTAAFAREDEEALSAWADKALQAAKLPEGWDSKILSNYPAAVRKRVLRAAAEREIPSRLEAIHLEGMDRVLQQGGTVSLPGGRTAKCSGGLFRIAEDHKPREWELAFAVGNFSLPDGRGLKIERIGRKEYEKRRKFNKLLFNNALDYATITDSTVLRSRRPGDVFRPLRRGVTKTLKKLLNEAAVPEEKRDSLVLLAAGGNVLWLERFGTAETAAVTEKTKEVVLILPEEL